MVPVVVRNEYARQFQFLLFKVFQYRLGLTRIHYVGLVSIVQAPNIVVGKGGDGMECEHIHNPEKGFCKAVNIC